MAASAEDWYLVGEDGGGGETLLFAAEGEKEARHRSIERSNLLAVTNMVIKGLIDSAMRAGKAVNDDQPQLQQFLTVMELTLKHRLKLKRNILGQKRLFWGVIECFEKTSAEFGEGVSSVRSIPGVKTLLGRGRAWLRFVLMQKKLADHFRTMVENRAILHDWYENDALMLCEEGMVVAGLLMGLNAIDYNVMMKGEDFDKSVGAVDLSPCLKDGNLYLSSNRAREQEEGAECEEGESELSQLLDQKAYLEELNKKLESSVERLQGKLHSLESSHSELMEKSSSLEESLQTITQERDELRIMSEQSSHELRRALENLQDDQRAELETYVQTRAGLNDLYSATQKNLGTETKLRQQLEQELEMQRSIRQEKETALQLLEKSTHEKQDTIVALRKQLEEMKSANIKMQTQLQGAKETHSKDSLKIRSLEGKLAQLTANSKKMEKEFHETRTALNVSEKTAKELGGKLEEVQLARSSAEADLAIEKQWRASLQMEIQREKDRVVELTNETKKFKALKKEYAELQERYAALQETVSDQEIALVEMGKKLSVSQQKIADMKDESTMMKESVWVDDRNITECQQCKKPFSVARRKHHCRNCGGIYCFACSENALQLASSAKPVRVCDSCYTLLLERASS